MMGIEVWERRPRPQRLPPGLLPSAPGVWRCRPAWAAGSWKEGALSGAGEVGWGALPPPFFGGASSGAGVEKLNRGEMSVGKRNAQGTGEVGAGWGTPGWAECSVHGQITQVSKGEVGQDSGPRRGARGLGSWGAGPPGAARSPARRRLGESSSAPRGPGPLFGALITRERLPRGFCGRTGAGGLAAGGSSGLGLATSPPSPPPAAGG